MSKAKNPSFVLTDRLPAKEVAPRLLGRIVADIFHPTHYYRPDDPRPSLTMERIEIVDTHVSSVLSMVKNDVVKAKVGDLLEISVNSDSTSKYNMKSKWVKTETLTQHPDALKNLLKDHRESIQELLERNGDKGYMIVGIKTCLEPSVQTDEESSKDVGTEMRLPTAAIIAAASHGALQAPEKMDVSGELQYSRSGTARTGYQGVGEQVFAIQYRKVTLKKQIPWPKKIKPPEVRSGGLMVVAMEDGVFGSAERSTGRKIDFDDEGDSKGLIAVELTDEDVAEDVGAVAAKKGTEVYFLPA